MAFDKEFISKVCDQFQCEQLIVSKDGTVSAVKPSGAFQIIPGFMFDTDSVSGAVTAAIIEQAKNG